MREIKFRGFDGMDWIYSNSIDYEKETDFWYMLDYKNDEWMIVNRVGQWTGLKDKNGKEIYEGDIVKGKAYEFNSCPRIIGKVIYNYCEFKVDSVRDKTSKLKAELNTTYEVIGNIYENPELLES